MRANKVMKKKSLSKGGSRKRPGPSMRKSGASISKFNFSDESTTTPKKAKKKED